MRRAGRSGPYLLPFVARFDRPDGVQLLAANAELSDALHASQDENIPNIALAIAGLPDGNLDEMSPADAMNVASRERMMQYAHKYKIMHKISEWEVHLDAAKGKVHECEETLQKLREEVEVVDGNIGRLESGMETLKHAMQRPQYPHNSVAGSRVRNSESRSTISSDAIASSLYGYNHQTRLATGDTSM